MMSQVTSLDMTLLGHDPRRALGILESVWRCKNPLSTLGRSVRSVWGERERSVDLDASTLLSSQAMPQREKTHSVMSCRMMSCHRKHECIYLSAYFEKAELTLAHIQWHGKGERGNCGLWKGRSPDHNLQWLWTSGNVGQCIVHKYVFALSMVMRISYACYNWTLSILVIAFLWSFALLDSGVVNMFRQYCEFRMCWVFLLIRVFLCSFAVY